MPFKFNLQRYITAAEDSPAPFPDVPAGTGDAVEAAALLGGLANVRVLRERLGADGG